MRLKKYRFFNMGKDHEYLDDYANRAIMQKVARGCYLPMNELLAGLIRKNGKKFKVSFSISGIAVEQFRMYAPEVLDSFQALARTGCVEFLAETYSHSLAALADPAAFARRWPAAKGQQPMVLAVGDGNHSLATAKAYWEELKPTLSEEQRRTHPARWCLAEVCNVHSPAIEIEPIHRVLFNVDCAAVLLSLITWSDSNMAGCSFGGSKQQPFTLAGPHMSNVLSFEDPTAPLTVGTIDEFIEYYLEHHKEARVDYVHDEPAVRALCKKGAVAFLMPPFAKSDLFKGVVMGGVLPRKTFSMGHAEEKRYYVECRKITE